MYQKLSSVLLLSFTFFLTMNAHQTKQGPLKVKKTDLRPLVFSIHGNTGAGKTTLMKILGTALNAYVVKEQFSRWLDIGGKGNLFKTFLDDKGRWAYSFQWNVFKTHLEAYVEALKNHDNKELIIMDRSMWSSYSAFNEMMLKDEHFNAMEYQLFVEHANFFAELADVKIDGVIYLRTSPDVCFERAEGRARTHKDSDAVDFYNNLGKAHDEWLLDGQRRGHGMHDVPVLVLDGNADFEHLAQERVKVINQVYEFIEAIKNKCTQSSNAEKVKTDFSGEKQRSGQVDIATVA